MPSEPAGFYGLNESEKLAKLFHETYEQLAPKYDYKTREASAVPWEDVPLKNRQLMEAVAHEVHGYMRAKFGEDLLNSMGLWGVEVTLRDTRE